MSVINKMLKDLEVEQDLEVSAKGNIFLSKKKNNYFIILTLSIIVIIFLLFFMYQTFTQKNSNSISQNKNYADQFSAENKKQSTPKILQRQVKKPIKAVTAIRVEAKSDSPIKVAENSEEIPIKLQSEKPVKPLMKVKSEKINQQKTAEIEKIKSKKSFKISKSKIVPKQQAQRYWNDAEKQPQNAEKLLNKAINLDSALHGARLQLIALLTSQKRLSDAERVTDKGLILLPQDPSYIEWKARIRVALNDSKTGLQWLLKVSPDIEKHINYYGFLATLASQLKYNDIAAEAYLKLSIIQPKHGPWLLGMAISEERLGKNQTAKKYYQKAQTADGLTPRARLFIQQKLNKLES